MTEVTNEGEPLWYKDAVIYELHVRAFADSNADGIGDFAGLTQKLDYLRDLGVTALWLLPFYPSPLRDDGYDIADYFKINPAYGTLKDFRRFLKEAHRRGLRVITELVVNHTSTDHPWFQRARNAPPGSKARDFYVWSDTPKRYEDTRIIFKDFETSNWSWDPVAQAYYWHRFYSHQPDLNFDNPEVEKALLKVVDFWLDMGVDGMRLDAVPYLYEREGTNCENLPETHQYLKRLRKHIDDKYSDRMLLAEANQWPEDAAAYFGDGDECHMNFHFPLMPRMFMAVQLEDSFPITDISEQTPQIPDNCQWATFLRNHDELTLEMVTDEDRDYMYRVYAADSRARINVGIRRRLAPLLGLRRKVELMNSLLFSLPGTPVIYYGDEIGMGDNIYLGDRNGVRTPMQWSGDRNAGFSRANPQKLYFPVIIDPEYHYEAINVEVQENNVSSLLWWMKRLIALRRSHRVFGRGAIEFLNPHNSKVLAFIRSDEHEHEHVLVVANLSRFAQHVELELQAYEGQVPVEMFGRNAFPPIGAQPYFLSLGPHSFLWFTLEPAEPVPEGAEVSLLKLEGAWTDVLDASHARDRFRTALRTYLPSRRWFRSKSKTIKSLKIQDAIRLPKTEAWLLFRVEFADGAQETYSMPLAYAVAEEKSQLEHAHPESIVCRCVVAGEASEGVLYDAVHSEEFAAALINLAARRRPFSATRSTLSGRATRRLRDLATQPDLPIKTVGVEQSNTSIIYGEAVIMKLFRRVEEGINPDAEVSRYLSDSSPCPWVPRLEGTLELSGKRGSSATLAIIQQYVPNHGDAWSYALDTLNQYFERCLSRSGGFEGIELGRQSLLSLSETEPPAEVAELMGTFLPWVALLGERAAEMHLALAAPTKNPDFEAEPFSALYQRSLYQSTRSRLKRVVKLLERKLSTLQQDDAELARRLRDREGKIDALLRRIVENKLDAHRIRCHGDFHLGQVLYTGKDFYIIDFEGEPGRELSERRFKRSVLRDVAGMLRSFQYASVVALRSGPARSEDWLALEPWAELWYEWASATFLRSYLDKIGGNRLLPSADDERALLLGFYLLDKCLYELEYELNNRPTWVSIPLRGAFSLLDE